MIQISLFITFTNLYSDLRPLCKFFSSEPLPNVLSYFNQMRPVNTEGHDAAGKLWIQLHAQAVANLMGIGNSDPCLLVGKYISDPSTTSQVLNSNSELKYVYYVAKLILAVIHRSKYIAADIICKKLPKVMSEFPVTLYHVMVTFLGALAIIDKDGKTEQDMELLNTFARDLKDWSKTNPTMFMHKHLLVQAEMSKLNLLGSTTDPSSNSSSSPSSASQQNGSSASGSASNETTGLYDTSNGYTSIMILDIYEDAINSAMSDGFINEAAIINERCGEFLQQHSKKRSLAYFKEAVRLYTLWGANRRAQQILAKIPELESPAYGLSNLGSINASIVELQDLSKANGSNGSEASANSKAENPLLRNLTLQQQIVNTQSSSPLRWILSNLFREDRTDSIEKEKKHSITIPGEYDIVSPVIPVAPITSSNSSTASYSDTTAGDLELKTALQYCLDISEAIEVDSVLVKFVNSVIKSSGADYCVFVSLDNDEPYIDAIGILNGVKLYNHEPMSSRADVPLSVVYQVVSSGQLLSKDADPNQFELVYGRDPYFQTRHSQSILCMPIQNQLKTVGAVYIEHQALANIFTQPRIELLGLLCTQVVMSLEKAKLYHQMEVAKKAAEEATEEKASFLANMSHEIRTPFNALLSCSIFLLDTRLSEIQREYVEIIRSSAMLTLNIIDAILAFSKIEHGSITLESAPFSLRECVESAIQLVAEPAAKKELELVHLNYCGEIDIIYGDVTRVRQIIINLVGNAVKFTSEGHILVETHAEKVSSDNRYEFVITVKDTGIGIPKSARNKVFRAFSQVDGSSRRVYGGSGLGLAISKKLAELMGGNLSFESNGEDKEGTTFWFDLVTVAKKQQDPEIEEFKLKNEGKKVLVVDHLKKTKESLVMVLQRLGFVVESCCECSEAIRMMRRSVLAEGETLPEDGESLGVDDPSSSSNSLSSRRSTSITEDYAVPSPSIPSSASLLYSSPSGSKPALIKPTGNKYELVFIEGKLLNSSDCSELSVLKSLSPSTRIVFMTTFGAPIPEDAKENGISAILMLPIQRSKLLNVLHAILDPPNRISEYDENGCYTSPDIFSGWDDDPNGTESIKNGTRRIEGMEGVEGVEESVLDMQNNLKLGDPDRFLELCCDHDCSNPIWASQQEKKDDCSSVNSNGMYSNGAFMLDTYTVSPDSGSPARASSSSAPTIASKRTTSSSSISRTSKPMLANKHPLKILLAEDNPINTRVALQHLKRMGYAADHAKDGVEVLSMCQREYESQRPMYDCILMDIQMPNKDGIATAQELMVIYTTNERPQVIALTANAAGEDRQRCLSVGMSNYIAKPILPADLASVLMSVEPLRMRNKSLTEEADGQTIETVYETTGS